MQLEHLPHWDMSNVYPSLESQEFDHAVSQVEAQLDELDSYLSAHQIAGGGPVPPEPAALASVISGYLDRMNALLRLLRTLEAYVYAFVSTDSYNTTARRIESELDPLDVRRQRQEVLFQGWMGSVAERTDHLEAALAQVGPAHEHAFYLRETAEQSRYLMSEAEETLAAELSLSGGRAWAKLQEVVTSQVRATLERDGQVEELPIVVIQNLRTDPDGSVRQRAFEAELAAWEGVREPLAACMNGVKGSVNTLDRRRGRTGALHQVLDEARMDRATLEAMLGAMHDSFPMFRRYLQAKARRLGKAALPWWDLFAPAGRSTRRYTFGQAQDFILEQFSTYSPHLAIFAQRAFEQSWIDAEPRDGKGGGAFCMDIPAVDESRILCNFDGALEQVSYLAHELGHAYHTQCQVGKTQLQTRTPMTLAETASTFCETIVSDAVLAQATGTEEELAILELSLIGATQIVVDIYSRYLFEMDVFERRANAELSADELCSMMLQAQKATYGDGLDANHLHPYMWAWKPHYYDPSLSFYNFPYAFGLLFGLGLYAIYQEQGSAFLTEYDQLLRSTGEGTAAEFAARFGIEIQGRAFWEKSLQVIGRWIERYLEI